MYLNNETALKGNIEQLKKENENLSNSVSSKVKECEALGEKTANLDSQLLILQKENITKSETIEALKGEMKSVKESNQVGTLFNFLKIFFGFFLSVMLNISCKKYCYKY